MTPQGSERPGSRAASPWWDGADRAECLCDEIDPADTPCLVCECVVLQDLGAKRRKSKPPWSRLPGFPGTPDGSWQWARSHVWTVRLPEPGDWRTCTLHLKNIEQCLTLHASSGVCARRDNEGRRRDAIRAARGGR